MATYSVTTYSDKFTGISHTTIIDESQKKKQGTLSAIEEPDKVFNSGRASWDSSLTIVEIPDKVFLSGKITWLPGGFYVFEIDNPDIVDIEGTIDWAPGSFSIFEIPDVVNTVGYIK